MKSRKQIETMRKEYNTYCAQSIFATEIVSMIKDCIENFVCNGKEIEQFAQGIISEIAAMGADRKAKANRTLKHIRECENAIEGNNK